MVRKAHTNNMHHHHHCCCLLFAQTYFQSGDNIPLGEFPEHQAEVGVHQVVDLLRAVDSRDVTQLRVGRRVEADEARDDATLPGQHLRSSAAAGRL